MSDTLATIAQGANDRFQDVMARIRGLVSPQPQAYSRITRTPIYIQDPGGGLAGQYKDGAITVSPQHLDVIPHESAHAIYDQAGLKGHAPQLAPLVPEGARNRILADPTYRSMGDYAGSPEQLSDEGLAYSIGDPDRAAYVNHVASTISNPKLAGTLLRLNASATGAKPAQ